jgi:hypothetical protein
LFPPPPIVCFIVAEVELMKERFAKLLLGDDMSGGAKGVCTALAISNAITNLSGISSLNGITAIWIYHNIFSFTHTHQTVPITYM